LIMCIDKKRKEKKKKKIFVYTMRDRQRYKGVHGS
jgi:hypothetical protein